MAIATWVFNALLLITAAVLFAILLFQARIPIESYARKVAEDARAVAQGTADAAVQLDASLEEIRRRMNG